MSAGTSRGSEAPVLLTGFAPFDGQQVNASWLAVQEVARTWSGPTSLVVERLPVSFESAPRVLLEKVARYRPRLVVAVGEAGGRSAVSLERVAVNVADASIPDADGHHPVDEPVVADGPVGYLSGLPLRACLTAVRPTGVPVEISGSAGAYVCNALFYRLMAAVEGDGVAAGFVHVPRTPGQVHEGEPAMVTPDAALALRVVLDTVLAGV